MRILYISKGLLGPAGGAQYAAFKLLEKLIENDIKIDILTDNTQGSKRSIRQFFRDKRVKIYQYKSIINVPLFGFLLEVPLIQKKIKKITEKEDFSCIHAHSYAGYYYSVGEKSKTLVTFHNLPSFYYRNNIVPGIYGMLDTMWSKLTMEFRIKKLNKNYYYHALSNEIKEDLIKQGVSKEHIFFLPNGIEKPPKPTISLEEFRNKWNIKIDDIVLFTVGRLNFGKGIHELIKALSKTKNKHLKTFIIGPPAFGIGNWYINYLNSIIKKYNLNVTFTGKMNLNNISEFYYYGDYYVSPSLSEGCQLALLEAKSTGCNFISTQVGCAEYFKRNGDYIYNKDCLSDLIRILNTIRKTKIRTIDNEIMSWNLMAKKMIKIYEKII